MACEGAVCGTGGWAGPLPGDPDNNAILSAFGVADGIQLSWTLPLTNAYAVSFVKIFRGTTGLFVNAVHIKTEGGDSYLDRIPVNDFQTYFYWIQIVTINGTELDVIGPASAAPINGFYELAARLSGKIDSSFLAGELRDHLDLIDVNAANIAAEVQNRLSENQAFANVLAAVQADVDGAITLVQSEITERSSADAALVDSVNALAVGLDGNAAAIVDEQIARISADGAMAADIQTLFTTVDGVNATIHEVETTKVGYSVLSSTKAIYDGDGVLDVYPALAYPAEDFPEYAINRKRIIDKNGVTEWNAIPANASRQVEWVVGLPLASAVKSVVVAGPDGYAGLEQAFLAQQDLNDGFKAMYTAKVDVNGVVGGFGLYNDGETVDALFDVDNFAVGKADQSIKPFIIDTSGPTPIISLNGQVYIGNRTAEAVATQLAQTQVKSICFQRATNRPATPTGGSYISPTPAGWSDGIPTGTLPVWMATRIFTSDALSPQQAGWTTPEKVGELGAGTKAQFSVDGATSWHDTPSTNDYYMRTGTSTDGGATWNYAGAVKIKGETGAQGNQGIQGIAGTPGADGVTYYTWIKYADTPTTGMSDFPSGKKYLGVAYNKTTPTESSTYADYAWSLIQGDQGIPGPAGADGQTTYTWIKYADSAAGAGMSDSPTGKTYIGIAPNKSTATESTTAGDYTWALIQGPQGPQGNPGTNGVRGSRSFYVSGQTVWSSTLATTTATVDGGPILNDVVTQYGTGFSQTRFWNGSTWLTITVAIDGNLLVTGTVAGTALVANSVTADKIDSRGLSIKDASGNVILAAGSALRSDLAPQANANLVRGFKSWYRDGTINVNNAMEAVDGTYLRIPNGQNYVGARSPTLALSIGGTYTVSFKARSSVAGRVLHVDLSPDTLPESSVTLTSGMVAYSFTWTSTSADMANCVLRFFAEEQSGDIFIVDPKLEAGSTKSAWVAHSLDVSNINITMGADGQLSGAGGGQVTIGGLGYTGDLNATKNTVTSSTTAPASPTDGDVWIDTNAPVTIKTRVAGAWVAGGNVATSLAHVNGTEATKLSGIAVGATANVVTSGVFASRPTGANGDFYYATNTSVLYQKVAGSWVQCGTVGAPVGTYVGSTLAQTVESNAATALSTANTAATNANAANALLTDIASDAKLTPSEKHDVRREWNIVINEKAGINTNAGLYAAAATANTAYNTAMQTLGTYLNNGAAYTLSTSTPPSWINDASLGTTTAIVGATFRSNWQAMYAARQALLNKIAEEAGKVSTWAGVSGTGKPADNATVGADATNLTVGIGSNLLRNSDFLLSDSGWSVGWVQNAAQSYTFSRDLASPDWTPKGGHTVGITRWGTTAGVIDFGFYGDIPVVAGARYEFSALLACHRTDSLIIIGWYDSTGTWISESGSPAGRAGGGTSLASWRAVTLFGTAPANAVSARVWVRTNPIDSGQINCFSWLTQPHFGRAGANQTTASQWTAANFVEQINSGNIGVYMADAAIGSAKIMDAAITNAKIGTAAIQSANIADAAITSAKIGNLVVSSAHIQDLTVDTIKIADGAITDTIIGTWGSSTTFVNSYYSPTYTITPDAQSNAVIIVQADYHTTSQGCVLKLFVDNVEVRSVLIDPVTQNFMAEAVGTASITFAVTLTAAAHTIKARVSGYMLKNKGGFMYIQGAKK